MRSVYGNPCLYIRVQCNQFLQTQPGFLRIPEIRLILQKVLSHKSTAHRDVGIPKRIPAIEQHQKHKDHSKKGKYLVPGSSRLCCYIHRISFLLLFCTQCAHLKLKETIQPFLTKTIEPFFKSIICILCMAVCPPGRQAPRNSY